MVDVGEMDSEFSNFMILVVILIFTLIFMKTCVHAGEMSRLRQSKKLRHCFPVPPHISKVVPPHVLRSLTFTHLNQLYRSRPESKETELAALHLTSDVVSGSVKVCRKSVQLKTLRLEICSAPHIQHVHVQFFWGVSPDLIGNTVYDKQHGTLVTKNKQKIKGQQDGQEDEQKEGGEIIVVAQSADDGDSSDESTNATNVRNTTDADREHKEEVNDITTAASSTTTTTSTTATTTMDTIESWQEKL